MALSCGTVIYRRPCRSKPRYYTKCDVARIARKASETTGDDDIMVSVGLSLGYPILINGLGLADDVNYAADLKKGLDEYKSLKTPAEIVAVATQGIIGLLRVLVTRILIYMLTRQTEKLAKALAPAVLLSLKRHTIIGVPCETLLGDSNGSSN